MVTLKHLRHVIWSYYYSTFFLPENNESPLINILKESTENRTGFEDVKHIRTLLISSKRDSLLSDAEQSSVHGEVQSNFHSNNQQDAHESLLKTLDNLHKHTKLDLFPGLLLSQEGNVYCSIIRTPFMVS